MGHATIWRYKRLWCMIFVMISLFFVSYATAHDKVVVIPLMKDAPLLEPYAPLAAASPPDSAYAIGTYAVYDKVTGLFWQKEDDNIVKTWDESVFYCQGKSIALGSGPYYFPLTDWRLPSVDELMSIVYYGTHSPAINSVVFPGTNSSHYWSVPTAVVSGVRAWSVSFNNGYVFHHPKSNTFNVRCVRGYPARDNVYKNNGNGTVTDLATGLTWQRQDDDDEKTWAEAVFYCQGLPLAGGGWRLPVIKELQSIVDDRLIDPAIDNNAFADIKSSPYWSATTRYNNSDNAWYVPFNEGGVSHINKSFTNYVRCVC